MTCPRSRSFRNASRRGGCPWLTVSSRGGPFGGFHDNVIGISSVNVKTSRDSSPALKGGDSSLDLLTARWEVTPWRIHEFKTVGVCHIASSRFLDHTGAALHRRPSSQER